MKNPKMNSGKLNIEVDINILEHLDKLSHNVTDDEKLL